MIEGLIFGILGGVLGVLGGVLTCVVVSHIGIPMPPPPGGNAEWVAQIQIVPSHLYFAFFLAVSTSLVSSIIPAYKATKRSITESLRHNV